LNWRTSRRSVLRRQALTGVPFESPGDQESLFGTRRPRLELPRGSRGKTCASIWIDCGFRNRLGLAIRFSKTEPPSSGPWRSGGGPTLVRSASEAVKHPAGAGNPVLSRTCTGIHEVFWGPRRGANPPLIRGWFVRGSVYIPLLPDPVNLGIRCGWNRGVRQKALFDCLALSRRRAPCCDPSPELLRGAR